MGNPNDSVKKTEDSVTTKKINTDITKTFVPLVMFGCMYVGFKFGGVLAVLPAVAIGLFLGLWLDKKFPGGWRDLQK